MSNVTFWFTTEAARTHAAQAYEAAYGPGAGDAILDMALDERVTFSGYHGDTVADAINGGPLGGHYTNEE